MKKDDLLIFACLIWALAFSFLCCHKEPTNAPTGCPTADGVGSVTFYNFTGEKAFVAFNRSSISDTLPLNQVHFWLEKGQKIEIDTLGLVEFEWIAQPNPVKNNGVFTPKDCEETVIELE